MAARLVKENFMGLRKSPERTPAFLAAHGRNIQKCADPKTPRGTGRSSLNALKHGRFPKLKKCPRRTNNLSRRRRGAKPSKASKRAGISILCALAAWREIVCCFTADRGTNPTFFENETGMSFRIRVGGLLSFFVLFFSGTKLECPLESVEARGTNPNSKPNLTYSSCNWALADPEEIPQIRLNFSVP
jgi:hypothetical protein